MNIEIKPGALRGIVRIPPSKAASHRALLCAMLADGASRIEPFVDTGDMRATLRAAHALGAHSKADGGALLLHGIADPPAQAEIDCGESGSTLRFVLPVAAALGVETRFTGSGRLPQRPIRALTDALSGQGCLCEKRSKDEIITVCGRMRGGAVRIAGDVSSQYITGLLLALPLLEGGGEIVLSAPLQSRSYVDMTLQMLRRFGVEIRTTPDGWSIPGPQRYRACHVRVEGDYSSAAFWLCAGALGSDIEVRGLAWDSLQGDRAVADILEEMGTDIRRGDDSIRAAPDKLRAVDVDARNIPDLVPALAAVMALADGRSTIYNAGRLRLKESDRLATTAAQLTALGAVVAEQEDRLIIDGRPLLAGGEADGCGDHRIAMALSIAALRCKNPVRLRGTGCVSKSYPGFYEHFRMLGGICRVL